jgi:hypothetical protein
MDGVTVEEPTSAEGDVEADTAACIERPPGDASVAQWVHNQQDAMRTR